MRSSSKSTGSSIKNDTSSEQDGTESPVNTDQIVSCSKTGLDAKHTRLVEWNVDVVKRILVEVVTRRRELGISPTPVQEMRKLELQVQEERIVFGAVKEIVSLPKYTKGKGKLPAELELSDQVTNQLLAYITALAGMYRHNPFHNFEVSLLSCRPFDQYSIRLDQDKALIHFGTSFLSLCMCRFINSTLLTSQCLS